MVETPAGFRPIFLILFFKNSPKVAEAMNVLEVDVEDLACQTVRPRLKLWDFIKASNRFSYDRLEVTAVSPYHTYRSEAHVT